MLSLQVHGRRACDHFAFAAVRTQCRCGGVLSGYNSLALGGIGGWRIINGFVDIMVEHVNSSHGGPWLLPMAPWVSAELPTCVCKPQVTKA